MFQIKFLERKKKKVVCSIPGSVSLALKKKKKDSNEKNVSSLSVEKVAVEDSLSIKFKCSRKSHPVAVTKSSDDAINKTRQPRTFQLQWDFFYCILYLYSLSSQ